MQCPKCKSLIGLCGDTTTGRGTVNEVAVLRVAGQTCRICGLWIEAPVPEPHISLDDPGVRPKRSQAYLGGLQPGIVRSPAAEVALSHFDAITVARAAGTGWEALTRWLRQETGKHFGYKSLYTYWAAEKLTREQAAMAAEAHRQQCAKAGRASARRRKKGAV